MASASVTSWQREWEKAEAETDFISNITVDADCSHAMECYSAIKKKIKFCYLQQHGWAWKVYVKWNKSDKNKYCMISLLCGILKIQQTSEYSNNNKTGSQIYRTK